MDVAKIQITFKKYVKWMDVKLKNSTNAALPDAML